MHRTSVKTLVKANDLQITYEGSALDTGEMNVRELAPALLAIGDLLTASTQVLRAIK
ncbi:hypothetical protein [Orrella sp. 11846]|uniref:hypothetical protein n=1 Tax=Orrella sp. 11846 TaxID=3409913 RepID=UPI003B59B780